ncbi:MAG: nucleotide exchange factor GrpE [Dehalococcoidales bacterium]|nr:nucleotide exchange factor GrpE [Dehalococcoidales bacterium]
MKQTIRIRTESAYEGDYNLKQEKDHRELENDKTRDTPIPAGEPGAEAVKPISAEEMLRTAEEKANEYLTRLQRAQADFINFKRRVEQERSDYVRQAGADIILGILPVLDDIDRALEAVPGDIINHPWVEGVRHISRKLHSELEARGLQKMEARGKVFDPNVHESVALAQGKEDIVIEEIKPGYMLYDRVLRPCSVIVGNGESEPCSEAENKNKRTQN